MKNLFVTVLAVTLIAGPVSAQSITLFGGGITVSTSKGGGTNACIRKDGNGGCIRLPSKNRK